jgi:hypothetical protein
MRRFNSSPIAPALTAVLTIFAIIASQNPNFRNYAALIWFVAFTLLTVAVLQLLTVLAARELADDDKAE